MLDQNAARASSGLKKGIVSEFYIIHYVAKYQKPDVDLLET